MTITILRPSTRILTPGSRGLRFAQPGGGAAIPWWMAAGVTPITAWQAKGAASYADSLVNLAQPGTHNLAGEVHAWSAETGWAFVLGKRLDTGVVPTAGTWTYIVRLTAIKQGDLATPFGCSKPGIPYVMAVCRTTNTGWYNGWLGDNTGPLSVPVTIAIADRKVYLDGIDQGLSIIANWPANPRSFCLGGANGYADPASCSITHAAIFSVTLSGLGVAAVSAAIAAL